MKYLSENEIRSVHSKLQVGNIVHYKFYNLILGDVDIVCIINDTEEQTWGYNVNILLSNVNHKSELNVGSNKNLLLQGSHVIKLEIID